MTSALASGAGKAGTGHTGLTGFSEVRISDEGSTRGTAYIENSKILTACGKLHVAWLDAGRGGREGVRIRTLDLQRGQWSAAVTLGEADDNHGGPAIVRDGNGYLHALYGPHANPLSYRRSVRPDDTSGWTPVAYFGLRCTYPSMVCDSGNTLHMVCRDSSTPGWTLMYYCRKEGGSWSEGRPLLEPTDKDDKYRCYRGSLFLDRKDVLHLGFMLFGGQAFKDAQEKGLAGYLGLAPRLGKSAGKNVRQKKRCKNTSRAGQALRMAASALYRSESELGAYFRSVSRRADRKTAVKATARRMAHLIYRGVRYGQAYVEQGAKAYEDRMRERTVRAVRNLVKIHNINVLELNMASAVA